MPKITKHQYNKTIIIVYDSKLFHVAIHRKHSAAEISKTIRNAIGEYLPGGIALTTSDDKAVNLSWHELNINETYKLIITSQRRKPKIEQQQSRMDSILSAWCLEDASQIFPAEIAPRVPLQNGQKAHICDNAEIMSPGLWTQKFTTALWKMAVNSPIAHKEAVDVMMEVVHERYADESCQSRNVQEILTFDLEKAWARKKARIMELAGEADAVLTYTGGLLEGIEEVEEDMAVEKFAGGWREAIDQIDEELETENGTTS